MQTTKNTVSKEPLEKLTKISDKEDRANVNESQAGKDNCAPLKSGDTETLRCIVKKEEQESSSSNSLEKDKKTSEGYKSPKPSYVETLKRHIKAKGRLGRIPNINKKSNNSYPEKVQELEDLRNVSYQKVVGCLNSFKMSIPTEFSDEQVEKGYKDYLGQLLEAIEVHERLVSSEVCPLPPVDGNYEIFPNGKGDDAYDWLKEKWGYWLTHFNDGISQDYLFQNELRKRDPDLMNRLRSQRKRILAKTKLEYSEIIPTITVKIDQELGVLDESDLRAAYRINAVYHRRNLEP